MPTFQQIERNINPWEKVSENIKGATSILEAIPGSSLDWDIELVPIYTKDGKEIKHLKALSRNDNNEILSVVSSYYNPLKNKQGFQVFDRVVRETNAQYEAMGMFNGGQQVYALARLSQTISPLPHDTIDPYLLLLFGHDGKTALHFNMLPLRLACRNMLKSALSRLQDSYRLFHKSNLNENLAFVGDAMVDVGKWLGNADAIFKQLTEKKVSSEQTKEYLDVLFPEPLCPQTEDDSILENYLKACERVVATKTHIINLTESGKGTDIEGVKGTAWGLVNAVTEYFDWHYRERKSNAFQGHVTGQRAEKKRKAFELALSLN